MWTEGTHVGSVEDVATAKLGAFLRPDSSHIYEWTARDVREAVNHIVDGHRKLPTGGHLWRILWPWFLPAYGQIVPRLL